MAGFVRTSFGVAGEVKIESYSGEYAHLLRQKNLSLRDSTGTHDFVVESMRKAHGHAVTKLEGIDSPEEAKKLRGAEIILSRREASTLGAGEYYYADLMGLDVCVDGVVVGNVSNLYENAGALLLEVARASGSKHIVPFSEAFVGEVDLAKRTLEVVMPEVLD